MLAVLDAGHPLLQATGQVHWSEEAEIRWHREFGPAYDAVAIANQIAVSAKAISPWERVREVVLRKPVECR